MKCKNKITMNLNNHYLNNYLSSAYLFNQAKYVVINILHMNFKQIFYAILFGFIKFLFCNYKYVKNDRFNKIEKGSLK